MPCDRIVALNVKDETSYQQYRDGTAPVMRRYGGNRLYDFRVSEALTNASDHPINRVFLVRFPDRAAMDGFFSDPDYRAIREQFFAPAVAGATVISIHEAA